jgi:outer membrane protein assembly factor BamB
MNACQVQAGSAFMESMKCVVHSALKARGQLVPIIVIMVISNLVAAAANPEGWPSWRGPHANGSMTAGLYPVKWDTNQVLWKVRLPGKGSSTPMVWKDRIFLTTPLEGQDAVMAFDFSGQACWQTQLGTASPPKHRDLGSSCNASPVTDGQSLYVYFRSGHLAALEFDGKVRWQTNLVERFGPDQLFWDQATSPVLADGQVIMARLHGGESWIAAFDQATGILRWKQPRSYPTPIENNNAYATPLVFRQDNREALLVWGADHLTAHDTADGKLLWSCGGFNPRQIGYWPAIASPVVVGNIAIVPVGRDDRSGQSRMDGIRLGGSGDVTDTHRIWKREDLGVFVCTPAAYDGRVYLLRHRGEVVCLDPATGQSLWKGAFPRTNACYYASPVVARGILYAAREDGVVFAARVEKQFEFLSENPMGERIIASPVPINNHLLIRGDEHLFCISRE